MINFEYATKAHGNVTIQVCNNRKAIIWIDPEESNDGFLLANSGCEPEDWFIENFFEGIDFSDLPQYGEFNNVEDAKVYIENKLGTLEEF